jgi:hypothetical protein
LASRADWESNAGRKSGCGKSGTVLRPIHPPPRQRAMWISNDKRQMILPSVCRTLVPITVAMPTSRDENASLSVWPNASARNLLALTKLEFALSRLSQGQRLAQCLCDQLTTGGKLSSDSDCICRITGFAALGLHQALITSPHKFPDPRIFLPITNTPMTGDFNVKKLA